MELPVLEILFRVQGFMFSILKPLKTTRWNGVNIFSPGFYILMKQSFSAASNTFSEVSYADSEEEM